MAGTCTCYVRYHDTRTVVRDTALLYLILLSEGARNQDEKGLKILRTNPGQWRNTHSFPSLGGTPACSNSPTSICTLSTPDISKLFKMCKNAKPFRYYFRWGSLRFAFHGIWATMTMVITTLCIVLENYDLLLLPSIIANQALASHAYSLLDQVPLSTKICRGFEAPHREAFKRTSAVMTYTNLRLAQPWIPTIVYYPALAFLWTQFPPINSDFRNGNTWIFVIPMFIGVSLDMAQSLVMEHHCALPSLVPVRWLLGVQLSAMGMAFAFTLAFRGIVSIRHIYFGAAFFVALLFVAECGMIFWNSNVDICSLGMTTDPVATTTTATNDSLLATSRAEF